MCGELPVKCGVCVYVGECLSESVCKERLDEGLNVNVKGDTIKN